MQSFIPHRDNPHTGRKIFGAIVIILISALITHFTQKNVAKSQTKVLEKESATNIAQREVPNSEISVVEEKKEDYSQKNVEIPDSKQLAATLEEAMAPPPIIRDKNPETRLQEAKIYTKPQYNEGKYIDISLSHQNMVLFEDGKFIEAYLVSSGKRGMETPIGTFQIQNKVPRAYSKTYGLYMPNWMALVASGKFGIHELPEWPNGYKEGANHLGVAVSHGCVRLGVGAAKRVFDWADVGTTVIVHK